MTNSEDRVTVWASSDLVDRMDDRVDWRNSSRSEWLREAVELRLALEGALERRGIDLPDDEEERVAMLEDIATAGVATFATDVE